MTETLAIEDPTLCGLGEGADCCAFLSGMPGAFVCGRTMPGVEAVIRTRLEEGTMNAKYDPGDTPFPECQERRTT